MGTRADIGIVNDDETITGIYTSNDGYVEHHGPILINYYATEKQVRALMALGDLSSLGEAIGRKHDFYTSGAKHPNWCCAYGRDRGETETGARTYKDKSDFLDGAEPDVYLFEDGKWTTLNIGSEWKDLTLEVIVRRLTK